MILPADSAAKRLSPWLGILHNSQFMPAGTTLHATWQAPHPEVREFERALENLMRSRSQKNEAAYSTARDKIQALLIGLAENAGEARENFDFFDHLSSSPERNLEAIKAFIRKRFAARIMGQNIEESVGRDNLSASTIKGVPIPKGLGASLRGAMDSRHHGRENACVAMNLNAKTLRKLFIGEGVVHQSTLQSAIEYIRSSSPSKNG